MVCACATDQVGHQGRDAVRVVVVQVDDDGDGHEDDRVGVFEILGERGSIAVGLRKTVGIDSDHCAIQ